MKERYDFVPAWNVVLWFLNSCLYPIPITQILHFTDILFRILARKKKVKNCKKLPIKKKIITHPSFTQTQNKIQN